MATHTRETMRIQARLDRALLAQLRDVVQEQGEELDRLRYADDVACMWESLHHAYRDAMSVGITPQGEIVILARP